MKNVQKIGGIAALGHTAALVAGMVLSLTRMFPLLDGAGSGPVDSVAWSGKVRTEAFLWLPADVGVFLGIVGFLTLVPVIAHEG
ncbi:MAG TPA: hypothetical protein VIO61_01345 [Anaerolineaceae bacterium]